MFDQPCRMFSRASASSTASRASNSLATQPSPRTHGHYERIAVSVGPLLKSGGWLTLMPDQPTPRGT
eukprot:7573493-Alexandrium_andersonii.AAC.1